MNAKMRAGLSMAAISVAVAGGAGGTGAVIRSEFLYERAAFPSCHASTLAETADGGLVAAFFGGTREGHADVGIHVCRFETGAWTPPAEVADGRQADGTRYPCWNPVLFQPETGPLLLFYKVGSSPKPWWGMLRTSGDGGRTWSDARRLPDGFVGPVKNKPVALPDGALLCPSSSENSPQPPAWRVHFERTPDLGKTWSKAAPPRTGKTPEAIQPSILFHTGGRLQALGRTRAGRVFETWSDDGAVTWSPLALTELPNPNAGLDAVTLRDGRHVLVYNPVTKGRTPLAVAVSADGRTWAAAATLENGPGEYSYPAVIQTRDGLVHVTYTWRRERIRHAVLDLRSSAVPNSQDR